MISEFASHSQAIAQRLLYSLFEKSGCQGRLVDIQHLNELQARHEILFNEALFDEEFYQEWLTGFIFSPPDHLQHARSIVIAAYLRPG